MPEHYDIAIIGGGPAGSTVGTILAKYQPALKIVILEREKFPRDHVGESQLPVIGGVLDEMEVWDKVEAANFPIKVGGVYRWGRTDKLWDLDFFDDLKPEPRPAKFVGQRTRTAFQVDRSIYDKILLDHARSMGCTVLENTKVSEVMRDGDKVLGLRTTSSASSGGLKDPLQARHYVDASGHAGILRRTMGVHTDIHTNLQNIAIWDYWQNAEWAVSVGVGGTRILVLSVGFGWLWFIPLGPTRTSIGLVLPAEYFKDSGKRPSELYSEAIQSDSVVSALIRNASCENKLTTTKDWSFLSERLAGENWFLVGEACGFADPILSAGLSLAHTGARDVAYAILSLDRGEFEADWVKRQYDESHRHQISNHIRFADFWYTQNGNFIDLQEYTRKIAGEMGLEMTVDQAWNWFGQGGFIDHNAFMGHGAFGFRAAKQLAASFVGERPHFEIVGKTHFRLNLEGANKDWVSERHCGRITRRRCYKRDGKCLPTERLIPLVIELLRTELTYTKLCSELSNYLKTGAVPLSDISVWNQDVTDTIEAMVGDGWISTRTVPGEEPWPDLGLEVPNFESSVKMPSKETAQTMEGKPLRAG